jgi:hypothetical protein
LKPSTALQRWLWFVGLWLAGVGTVTIIGLVIRLFLAP